MDRKAKFSLSLALAIAMASSAAFAQTTSKSGKELTPQQQRMVDCNHQATGKTGDERKRFMSTCLKGDGAAAAPTATASADTAPMTQQQKMKTCSADAKAKGLKGAERKTFMSTCLKGEAAGAH